MRLNTTAPIVTTTINPVLEVGFGSPPTTVSVCGVFITSGTGVPVVLLGISVDLETVTPITVVNVLKYV